MSDIQEVLRALQVFSHATDKASIDRANVWLQEFQHSVNTLSPLADKPTLIARNALA